MRAFRAKLANVTFLEADMTDLMLDAPVDAIVGRFVLMFLSDPASLLRQPCTVVRPVGLIAFQQMETTAARSVPPVALYEQALEWIRETFRSGGVELVMESRLFSTFCRAGLPEPELLSRARIEGAADSPAYEYVAQTLRSLLPLAETLGVTTAQEVQVDTLTARLRHKVTNAQAVIILPSLIGAWIRFQKASSSRV